MAASATCPKCGNTVTGDLHEISGHIGRCTGSAAKKKKAGKTPVADIDKPVDTRPPLIELSFFIPGELTTSLNRMLGAHVGQAYADKQRWRNAVGPLLAGFAAATQPRQLVIHRSAKSELDPDNLYASAKFLIDAIKKTGALVDDSSKWLSLDVNQGWLPCRGKGMLVNIKEINNE